VRPARQPVPEIDADQIVIDDFPTSIPVTMSELDVIEIYLRSMLDDILAKRDEVSD
jgi:hypothetical protein